MISEYFVALFTALSGFWITFWHRQLCGIIQDSFGFQAFLIISQTALYPYKEIETESIDVGVEETDVGHVVETEIMYTLHSHLLLFLLFLSSSLFSLSLLYSPFLQSSQLLTSNLPTT